MATTAERLKEIMTERGLRQADVLELVKPYCERYYVKLGKSDLSQFLKGKVTPGRSKLAVLGMALGVSEVWLMGLDVPRDVSTANNIFSMPAISRAPRLGSIACGTPILAEQNIEGYDNVPDFVRCDYTLKCKGDSMTGARINDGDIVYIRKADTCESGQIAAVVICDGADCGEATLKRVRFIPGGIALWPENPRYEPMIYVGEDANRVRIIGVATHFTSVVR